MVVNGEDARRAVGRASSMPCRWWWSSSLAGGAPRGGRGRGAMHGSTCSKTGVGGETVTSIWSRGLDQEATEEDEANVMQGASSCESTAWGGSSGCAGEVNSREALDPEVTMEEHRRRARSRTEVIDGRCQALDPSQRRLDPLGREARITGEDQRPESPGPSSIWGTFFLLLRASGGVKNRRRRRGQI